MGCRRPIFRQGLDLEETDPFVCVEAAGAGEGARNPQTDQLLPI